MFGIQVSLYFINSITITIFPNIFITIITENYMLQSIFSRSFCLLSVFLVRCLVDRGFCWRRLMLSVLFRLTASSSPGFPYCIVPSRPMPYHPRLLPNRLQCASWFRRLASSRPNFSHPERSARWRCKVFPLTFFFVTDQRSGQVMNPVNRWPQQRTHAREKLFAPGRNWTRIAQLRIRRSTSRPRVAPMIPICM